MSQCAGEPGLAHAARSGDEDVEVFAQPAPGGEGEDEGFVEAARLAEVDVLDAGVGLTQLRAAQSIGHAPVVAHGEFTVDEQAEALLERERLAGGGLELLGQCGGHAEALELVELVDDGVGQHGRVPPWWLSGSTTGRASCRGRRARGIRAPRAGASHRGGV